jgi:hypothetical protein
MEANTAPAFAHDSVAITVRSSDTLLHFNTVYRDGITVFLWFRVVHNTVIGLDRLASHNTWLYNKGNEGYEFLRRKDDAG